MQDLFTGKSTVISGRRCVGGREITALQHDHERRLEALACFGAAAAGVGIGTDPDDDLVLWAEDELSLFQGAEGSWGELAEAARVFRECLPVLPLEIFGFPAESEDPMGEGSRWLKRIGSGVEASAFVAEDGSVYKFYLPREEGRIGGSFAFNRGGEEAAWLAEATLGSYQALFEKLLLIMSLGGMPIEVTGVTPEGVVVAKQALGDRLPEGTECSGMLPEGLIPIPSRFLRAHRDHPRLVFVRDQPWFVADMHEKNLVRDTEGAVRVIDLLAAPWPAWLAVEEPLMAQWLERVKLDANAGLLAPVADDEL